MPFHCSPFCKCENAIPLAVAASIIICLAASGHGYNPPCLFFLAFSGFYKSSLSPVVQPEPPSHLVPLKQSPLFTEHNRLLGQIVSGLYCRLLRCTNWNPTSRELSSLKPVYILQYGGNVNQSLYLKHGLCSRLSRVLETFLDRCIQKHPFYSLRCVCVCRCVSFISGVSHGLARGFLFFFCWEVLSSSALQFSCHKADITVKIFPLSKQMHRCHGQGVTDFLLIARLSPGCERDAACQLFRLSDVFLLLCDMAGFSERQLAHLA